LTKSQEKLGGTGKPVKSNITDNDSARMTTSEGTIQGYNGIAIDDDKHQSSCRQRHKNRTIRSI